MISDKSMIESIRSHLQVLIGIAIFFPSFIYNFLRLMNIPEDKATISSNAYVLLVIFSLIIYTLFEIQKSWLGERVLKFINYSALIEIGAFIIPFLILGNPNQKPLDVISGILFLASLIVLLWLPIALAALLLFLLIKRGVKEFTAKEIILILFGALLIEGFAVYLGLIENPFFK